MTTTCYRCGAPVIYAINVRGKSVALDASPSSDGKVELQIISGVKYAVPRLSEGAQLRKYHTCAARGR